MKLIEVLAPDFSFSDERGSLYQITHEPFAQTNAVFSKKGAQRGNRHYHENAKEIFFVLSGAFDVRAELDGTKEIYSFSKGDMFLINENVRHTFDYKEDTYLVAFYSNRIEKEDGTKDIINE